MGDDEHDPSFAALPLGLQRRIDAAFDAVLKNSDTAAEPARKRRKLDSPQPGGIVAGGFIPEEPAPGGFLPEEPAPGGFIVDERSGGGFLCDDPHSPLPAGSSAQDDERPRHIPLSLIPAALQILDLQPDDEDVLAVFRNAAFGWGSRGGARDDPDEAAVSRKDWRAVCAALLDAGAPDDIGDEDVRMADGEDSPDAVEEGLEEPASDSGEDYVASAGGSESDAEDSDDEYREGGGGGGFVRTRSKKAKPSTPTKGAGRGMTKTRRGRKASPLATSSEEGDGGEHGLSARQKRECRAAFALFFPDVGEAELEKQRIRMKDITRVAKLLKEKITAEETVEMLEAFSSAADKSMGLADFERMMVAAKLA